MIVCKSTDLFGVSEKKSDSYFSKPMLMTEILKTPFSLVDNLKSPFSSDDVLSLVQFPSSSRSKMSAYGIPISDTSTILPAIIL